MSNPIKPNFLGVGTQKGGTTSMYSVLRKHPQIFLPDTKEIHYFDKQFSKGVDWYLSHFSEAENYKAVGEITPNYMYDPHAPKRIAQVLGTDIKLIFIFRNPANRAFSNYKMNVGRSNEKKSFKRAIESDLQKMKRGDNYPVVFHYIKRGFYSEQVKRFLKIFPRRNMLFLLFQQDTIDNRAVAFDQMYEFLGVDLVNLPVNVKLTPDVQVRSPKADKILNTAHPINQFAKKLIPSKKLRADIKYFFTKLNQKPNADKAELEAMRPFLINEVYKNDILELQSLIKRDLSAWLE